MNKRIWFITGISSGLGAALAQAVLERGDFVIGTFRRADQTEAFNVRYGDRGLALTVDVTRPDEVDRAAQTVGDRFGRVDVLVNNAGFGFAGAAEETSENELRKVFDTNFFGAVAVTRAFLPLLRRQGRGHILQLSSHSGVKGFPGFGAYSASKFALEGWSEALAAEVAPLGLRVTLLEPGPFRTRFAAEAFGEASQVIDAYAATAGAFRTRMKQVNGQQEGDPDKAARAILALVDHEQPPLRLPLGRIAIGTIRAKLESVQADLTAWESVAAGAVFDAP